MTDTEADVAAEALWNAAYLAGDADAWEPFSRRASFT